MAASAWRSPSTASPGARSRTISAARRTLSIRSCLALPWVENESIATRAATPSSRPALSAEATAMSASASASGSTLTAQSAKRRGAPSPRGAMMKKLDGVEMPGASPTDISPASMTRAVGWPAPATSASASPAFTAIAA